jgi:hypothetical protein
MGKGAEYGEECKLSLSTAVDDVCLSKTKQIIVLIKE